jgi:hypothetical protein
LATFQRLEQSLDKLDVFLLFSGQFVENLDRSSMAHPLGVVLKKVQALALALQRLFICSLYVHFAPILGSGLPDSGPPHSGV